MTVPDLHAKLIAAANATPPLALQRLRDAFDLDTFETRLAMLAFAYEIDPEIAAAVDNLAGATGPAGVPVWLAHSVLGQADWRATAFAASLRRWRVLHSVAPAPRAQLRLRLAEAVTDAMTGTFALDATVEAVFTAIAPLDPTDPALTAEIAKGLALQAGGLSPVILAPRNLQAGQIAACFAELGLRPYRVETARLAGRADQVADLQRLFERDSAMRPAALIADLPADPLAQEALSCLLDGLAAHVVLSSDTTPSGLRRSIHRLEQRWVAKEDAASQWKLGLGAVAAARLNGSVERAAAHFKLDATAIAQAAASIREPVERAQTAKQAASLFWAAAARAAWPEPGALARTIEPKASFDDLVVSPELHGELRTIVRQVRHAATVFGDWNFDRHGDRGRGTIALFSGPSGTGKTLAAEVIAHELDLPLVIADFSQLQSKWVGETPKLAARLFDDLDRGGAVLLIDEAEGMVGQRGAVADAQDRHANAEIGYFLQRLEAFRGLAILTTNMKHAIDTAFLRRFRFSLSFAAPDFAERCDLWRRAFPPAAPVDDLQPEMLARFNLTGGAIRNIALNAAFLAADAGGRIERQHIAHALRTEYRKLERPLSELEIGGFA